MLTRLRTWWAGVQDSLWFVPTVLTVLAVALAALTVQIDAQLLADGRIEAYLAFGGGAEGARGVLSAIAGSLVTVTGVVFSVTIVALQLASSQFTPRVLRSFTGDRVNQVVLGVFIATFTYTLLVLRTVRSAGDDGAIFVPSISVGIAILLALLSIGFLILYIHHAARSIQAAVIIDRVTRDARELVDRLFPEPVGESAQMKPDAALPSAQPKTVTAKQAGYLQAVDEDTLFGLAERGQLTIRIEQRIGDFVLPGAALASVWAAEPLDDDVEQEVRKALVFGPERTLQHDLEFAIRQLVDIAVKALSPGINDPTTAETCIDRLSEILVLLGNRRATDDVRSDESGRVCLVAQSTSFDRAVMLSFDQIRHYGRSDANVTAHVLRALTRVAELVPADRRAPLLAEAAAMLRSSRASIQEPLDRARIEQAVPQTGTVATTVRTDGRSAPRSPAP